MNLHTESHKHKSSQISGVSNDNVQLRIAHLLSGCDRQVCHDPSSVLSSPYLLLLEGSPEGRAQRTGNGWCPALSFRMEINYLVNIELVIQKRSSSKVQNIGCSGWREEERGVVDVSKLHQLSLQIAGLSFQRKDVNEMLQKSPTQVKKISFLSQNVREKCCDFLPSSHRVPLSSISE